VPSVSAQYSIILRVEIDHRPGMLGRVATAIGDAGGSITSIDLVSLDQQHTVRDITVETGGEEHAARVADAVRDTDGARLVDATDRTFLVHVGGKIEQRNKLAVRTRDDLSMAYTPGVARVCAAIARKRDILHPCHRSRRSTRSSCGWRSTTGRGCSAAWRRRSATRAAASARSTS
jgi:malate dehydrogenase (oxaloacetate-decarboxylating)